MLRFAQSWCWVSGWKGQFDINRRESPSTQPTKREILHFVQDDKLLLGFALMISLGNPFKNRSTQPTKRDKLMLGFAHRAVSRKTPGRCVTGLEWPI